MSFRRALCLLLFLGFWGCNAPQKPTAPTVSAFPRDDLGREIGLKASAKRVIVIEPGAIETIFALGAQKSLVGRGSFDGIPAAALKIPVAGDYQGPSVEKCVALQPDLVILQGETWDKTRVEQWQSQIGAPVAALVPTNLVGVRRDIEKIGAWTGQKSKARILAQTIREPAFSGRNSAFIEIGRSPLYTAGQNTLVGDVLSRGGWNNVAKVKGYQPYGIETLLAQQPDAYIAPSKASQKQVLEQLRQSPTLSKLKCVQLGRIIVINPDLLLRPGPRLVQGLMQLKRAASRLADAKAGKTRF